MRTRWRAACRVDVVQRAEEIGKVGGKLGQVCDGLRGGGRAVDSSVYRPRPREAASWRVIVSGCGMGSGSSLARIGSQRCSFSTASPYWRALGSRTDIVSPRRNIALSQPSTSTGRTVRWA